MSRGKLREELLSKIVGYREDPSLLRLLTSKKSKENTTNLKSNIIRNRCVVCNKYGCTPIFITKPEKGGAMSGDNVIPLCCEHSKAQLYALYAAHPSVFDWLIDHERIDSIAILESKIRIIGIKRRW